MNSKRVEYHYYSIKNHVYQKIKKLKNKKHNNFSLSLWEKCPFII